MSLHDTMEDRKTGYEAFRQEMQELIGPPSDEIHFHLIHLGVRMLTYLDGYSREEAEKLCYQGLLDPESVYGGMPEFKKAFEILAHDPVLRERFLYGLQSGKLADRVANWADFDYFMDSEFGKPIDPSQAAAAKTRKQLTELAGKTFQKTLNSMNRLLVKKLDDEPRKLLVERYYEQLAMSLKNYAVLDAPQARPLQQAALAAIPGLRENIKDHPFYQQSDILQDLVKQLGTETLVAEMASPTSGSGPKHRRSSSKQQKDSSLDDKKQEPGENGIKNTALRILDRLFRWLWGSPRVWQSAWALSGSA